jgi:hypothetical protein
MLSPGPGGWRLAALAGTVLLATGCADGAEAEPWRDELVDARSRATSDFEREVLSDGTIVRSEYDAAFSRVKQCLADNGVTNVEFFIDSVGFYNATIIGTPPDEVMDRCALGTTWMDNDELPEHWDTVTCASPRRYLTLGPAPAGSGRTGHSL